MKEGGKRKLTGRQLKFVNEYMKGISAREAAVRAGYSAKTASEQGYQLLQKTSVKTELDRRRKIMEEKTGYTVQ